MFTLKLRRRLRAQASLVDILGSSWIFAVVAIVGIALLVGVSRAVTNGITYEHEVASVHAIVTALERDKLASQAAFVPSTDLAGASNADGHEYDLYQQGLHHNGHFFAYCFTAAAGECQASQPLNTLAVYTYVWNSLPRNGGSAPSISVYRPPAGGLTGFSVHDYFGGAALVAHFAGIAALNAKTPFVSSCVPKIYHWGYPVTPAPGGYPALVSATCRAFRATLTDGRFSEAIGLTDQHIPFEQTVIIGTATPTPMPLAAAPNPLQFSSPVSPSQSFTASENNYGNRVTTPAQQYAIAGCNGIAQLNPSGSGIMPTYNGTSGDTTVAVLPIVSPAPSGANCTVSVTDNTPQTTSVPVTIGETFAPGAHGYAVNFTGASTVAPIVTQEQNYAVGPSQGGRGGFIFRYYSTETPSNICYPPSPANATVGSGNTVSQQWSVKMTGAGVCTAVFEDAYGRTFAAQVQANAPMATWPAGGIVEATSGSALAMLPMHEPLIAKLFGAEMADALTTGCKAVVIASGTFPVDASGTAYTPASISQLPPAAQTLLSGQGYTVDGSGCVYQHGALATQAPIVAYEPGGTSASTPKYAIPPNNCNRLGIAIGSWNPASATGSQAAFPISPGSTSGSCTVRITASPAPSGTPGPGSGLVPVQVAQYPCQFIGGSCTLPAGGLGQNTTACHPTTHSGSGFITWYRYYWYGTPPQSPSAPGPVPATVGTVSGLNPSTFTRTGPGTVYGIMVIMTRNMAGWPCRFTNWGFTWSLYVTVP